MLDMKRQNNGEAGTVMKNIMGFVNESPLDQNFLRKDPDNSMPSNSSPNNLYDF